MLKNILTNNIHNLHLYDILSYLKILLDNIYGNLSVPSKAGYTFDGWYTNLSGKDQILSTSISEKHYSHTLYAHWIPNSYYISFNVNEGSY